MKFTGTVVDHLDSHKLPGSESGMCLCQGAPLVNAYRYGNILCLVNDPSEIVFTPDKINPDYTRGKENVDVYPTMINNFLFGIMATTAPIKACKPFLLYVYDSRGPCRSLPVSLTSCSTFMGCRPIASEL